MKTSMLPTKIKDTVKSLEITDEPVYCIRANGNLDGGPGEAYVLAYEEQAILFSRPMGQFDYDSQTLDYANQITGMHIEKQSYNSFLNIFSGDTTYSIKFPSYDKKTVEDFIELWKKGHHIREDVLPPRPAVAQQGTIPQQEMPSVSAQTVEIAEPTGNITPSQGLIAALIFAAAVDGDIDDVEEKFIHEIAAHFPGAFDAALTYYQDHSFDDLLGELRFLDANQRLCLLANLEEMCMKDGVLHSTEQTMIQQYASVLGCSDENVNAIRQVLLLKNHITVFQH